MTNKEDVIDAEAVPTQAVAVRQQSGLPTVADLEQQFSLAVRQRELLKDYISKQLVSGKHFYQRGDQKPSLTKEGAEIILLPHNLAPDYEVTSGPEQPPEGIGSYQITVKCILRRKGDPGSFVGSGIGSAGSHKGYWKRERGKPDSWEYQPRQTDKYLCHNATLKMAQKSAMIAATINSTAASEFFTQDMDSEEPARPEPTRPATASKPHSAPAQPPELPKAPAGTGERIPPSPEQYRERFIQRITEGDLLEKAIQFCIDLGWLMPNEGLLDLPLRFVPQSKDQYIAFLAKLTSWSASGKAEKPYESNPEPLPEKKKPIEVPREEVDEPGDEDAWRQYPMPFGKNAGIALEDLEKNYLFGLWANYTVETEYKGKPKKPQTIEKDQEFRAMLDLAGKHYEFTKKD